jgi:hypothetical protein
MIIIKVSSQERAFNLEVINDYIIHQDLIGKKHYYFSFFKSFLFSLSFFYIYLVNIN